MLLTHGGLVKSNAVSRNQRFATYWSAVVHDFEHGGMNNDFLIKTSSPLALLYNDQSPLENHHLSASTRVVYAPENRFLTVSTIPLVCIVLAVDARCLVWLTVQNA